MKKISKRLGAEEYSRCNDNISDLLEAIYQLTGCDSYALETLLGELQQESRHIERIILQAGFDSDSEALYYSVTEKEKENPTCKLSTVK